MIENRRARCQPIDDFVSRDELDLWWSPQCSDLLELLLAASRANAGASDREEDIGELGHLQFSRKVSSLSVGFCDITFQNMFWQASLVECFVEETMVPGAP